MKVRGLTLIELIIALAIVVVLFATVVTGVGAITGSRAKAAAGELGGVIRSLYDTAALTGRTCRLVLQIPDPSDDQSRAKYWAECAASNVTTRRDRVEAVARYSVYTSPEITPRELPSGVHASVWTAHQRNAIGAGTAYLYFFPQGMTERALVFLRQGRNTLTLQVAPLTGKTTVVGEQLEVPR